jgi:hypothetical protein
MKSHTQKTEAGQFNSSLKNEIRKLLEEIGSDGHTIWNPSVLNGFPEAVRGRFIRSFKSSKKDPKGMIFVDGQRVEELSGVYGLTLLRSICSDLGLTYEDCFGRGTEARRATSAIEEWLAV